MATRAKTPKKRAPRRLNPKQELFCLYYTGELFGNGTMSFAAAYGVDLSSYSREPEKDEDGNVVEISQYQKHYMTCMVRASQLLRTPKVKEHVAALMAKKYNDQAVDQRHAELIHQREDPSVALGAIREYNRVKARVKAPGDDDVPPGAAPITRIEIVMPKAPPTMT